jgi:sugar phosphate isomerase/epimerase
MIQSLALNVDESEIEECASFCRREGLGIEVTAFAFPAGLVDDFEARIRRHAEAVEGLPWTALHGPFLDLYATSRDGAIVQVCRERHWAALRAAAEIGARVYVAHLNYLPMIRNESYRDRFVRAAAEFWLPFADDAGNHGITIVLENMWEPGPELQKAVVGEAKHPHLKASFDSGHALIFSDRPAAYWIEVLGEDMGHAHLHDNDGQYDHHWPIGDGKEDWPALLSALERYAPAAAVVLESDRFEENKRSLEALRQIIGDEDVL